MRHIIEGHALAYPSAAYQVDPWDQVERIMALEPEQAAVKALALLKLWNFPNNYTLGKRLTEIMASAGCG